MKPQDIDAIGVVVVGNLADLAAERAVLAGICRYGSDGYVEVSDIVDIDTFTIDSNQMLFKCLQKTLKDETKKLIDLPTILSSASELGLSEHFTKPDEIKHLRGITNLQVDFSNIRKFAGKIKKLHIARLYYHNLDLAKTDIASIRGDETVDEIVSLAENRILDLATVLNTGTGNQIKLMGQDGEEYLQYLIDNPRECIGIPTPFKRFNEAIGGGLRRQAIDVIAARFKKGKAQPLYSLVYTPDGPKQMGDMKVGDVVCTPTGIAKVIQLHPQGKKRIYRVYFSDNLYTDCCEDHLWGVYSYKKPNDLIIRSTKQLKENCRTANQRRWHVPLLSQDLVMNKKKVLVDPYLMGVLIGDGCFRGGATLTFTTEDKEILDFIDKSLIDEYKTSKRSKMTYSIIRRKKKNLPNYYTSCICYYGLEHLKSTKKFVPEDYKYNSSDVRLAIVQGLMDTDGSISEKGNIEYSSSSFKLVKDMQWLIFSLGGRAKVERRFTSCNGKSFKSYRLRISFDDPTRLFRLSRKISRVKIRRKNKLKRGINKIKYLGEMDCQCITLNTKDGLYITDNLIVTHNSFLGDNAAIYISGDLNIPVLNVDTEMSHHQHLHRIWANMSGVETKKIETGKMSPVEIKKVKDAQKKLRVMPYSYLCVKGMAFEEVLSLMRRWVVQHVGKDENGNTKDAVLIYDYIKLLDSSAIKNNFSEHQAVGYLMTSLVNFVGKHDISCLSFVQLNRDGITKESTDIISLSDRIGWFCGSLSLYKDKEPEEIGEDGIENGNKKLVNLATRFGEGMHFDDYINMNFRGSIGRITEGLTKFELIKEKKGAVTANCDNDIAF